MNLFSITPVGINEGEARKLINNVLPLLLENISYEVESYIPSQFHLLAREGRIVDGVYDGETRTIYLHDRSQLRSAIHEIGHAAHHQLFGDEMIVFSPEGKTEQAHLNHEEDFAEAFTELVLNMNNGNDLTKRDNEMKSLLTQVLLNS